MLNGQREGNFPLRPNASLTDGLFDYMHATNLSRGHLLRYLPAMVRGQLPENHPLAKLGRASRIHVKSETPLCVHADGEFVCVPEDGLKEVAIEVLPARMKVEVHAPSLQSRGQEPGIQESTTACLLIPESWLVVRNLDAAPAEIEVRGLRSVVTEHLRVKRVDYEAAVFDVFHKSGVPQNAQVMRNVDDLHTSTALASCVTFIEPVRRHSIIRIRLGSAIA